MVSARRKDGGPGWRGLSAAQRACEAPTRHLEWASMKTTSSDLQVFKAEFFRALAHPVRIRILEALVQRELTVGEIQDRLGLEQSLVSQQLSILRAKNIVVASRHGTTVRYAVRDPLLAELLDVARQIFDNHLIGTQTLLRELRRERRG